MNRRQAMLNLATASTATMYGLTANAATLSTARPDGDAATIDRLWRRRRALVDDRHRLSAEYWAAQALLPAWAAPGPKHLRFDGTYSGGEVGWPLWTHIAAPESPGIVKNVRPSPFEIRDERKSLRGFHGPKQAGDYYRRRMRQFISIRRAQIAEFEKVGLKRLERETELASRALVDVEDMISGIRNSSPAALASRLLASLIVEEGQVPGGWTTKDVEPPFDVVLSVVEDLRPQLSGVLRENADDLFSSDERPCRELEFWGA